MTSECVPLWYFQRYTLEHVYAELRQNGYTEAEAFQRVAGYADWLGRQAAGEEVLK